MISCSILVVATKGTASWIEESGAFPESDDTFGQVTIGLLPLLSGDLLAQVGDLLLHLGVGGIVLGGQDALLVAAAVQETR